MGASDLADGWYQEPDYHCCKRCVIGGKLVAGICCGQVKLAKLQEDWIFTDPSQPEWIRKADLAYGWYRGDGDTCPRPDLIWEAPIPSNDEWEGELELS